MADQPRGANLTTPYKGQGGLEDETPHMSFSASPNKADVFQTRNTVTHNQKILEEDSDLDDGISDLTDSKQI